MKLKLLLFMTVLFVCSCGQGIDSLLGSLNKGINTSNEKIPLGINIDWISDWGNMSMFNDIVKQARGFGEPDNPWKNVGTIKIDENGWPLEDFGIVLFTAKKHLKDKVYNVSFETDKLISLNLIATKGKIFDIKFNDEKKIMTAKIFIPKEADQLMLSFKNTNKGVRNIKIVNELSDEKETYTKEFIDMHKGFGVLRFMELQNTNRTKIQNWEERAKITDVFQNNKGLAWEYAIDICNKLNSDIWINIPHMATDNYITELANLLKENLDKDLKIYVEYSNEPWNLAFFQNPYIKMKGIERGIVAKNEYFVAAIESAVRLKEISVIFSKAFGAESINSKIRPVLGGQIVWTDVVESALQYIDKNYGKPSKYFYAFGGGAYISATGQGLASLDEIYYEAIKNIENAPQRLKYERNMNLSKKYGMKFISYEGGIDIVGLDFKIKNNLSKEFITKDPRMAELIKKHLEQWYQYTDNGLFMWYKSGASEAWGLTESMDNLDTVKLNVLKK